MKRPILLIIIVLLASNLLQAQERAIARGAEPGELYLTSFWYGIYHGSPPYYDTLRTAVYRITNHGENVSIQYDVDYFSDDYTIPGSVMQPLFIMADATPGVLYNRRSYSKNYYTHTQLWVSFDYGKNWVFREENMGANGCISSYKEGVIYKGTTDDEVFISNDYANTWDVLPTQYSVFFRAGHTEEYFGECEFIALGLNEFYYTHDCYQNYELLIIGSEFSAGMSGFFPDVYRGNIEGEVFIHSWFYLYKFRVSFSADTAHTFRHVYVNDDYQWQNSLFDKNQLLFMSDREPGVFYILNLLQIEDVNPGGFHLKLCIHYYRDYGETLVDVYCHDINKNYPIETCESVTDLASEKQGNNSVLLTWMAPGSDLTIDGYRVYRNHHLLNEELLTDTFYLDENLSSGEYNYNVLTFYTSGCISEISNIVSESVEEEEICEAINDLTSEIVNENNILLIWSVPISDLEIEGYNVFRNNTLLTDVLLAATSYLDENLTSGNYEYYVVAYYANACVSDSSNHVVEIIGLGINDFADGISIYPNPTTGQLTIESGQLTIENVTFFDALGRNIFVYPKDEENIITIDISQLKVGIYFVHIQTITGITVKKILKY